MKQKNLLPNRRYNSSIFHDQHLTDKKSRLNISRRDRADVSSSTPNPPSIPTHIHQFFYIKVARIFSSLPIPSKQIAIQPHDYHDPQGGTNMNSNRQLCLLYSREYEKNCIAVMTGDIEGADTSKSRKKRSPDPIISISNPRVVLNEVNDNELDRCDDPILQFPMVPSHSKPLHPISAQDAIPCPSFQRFRSHDFLDRGAADDSTSFPCCFPSTFELISFCRCQSDWSQYSHRWRFPTPLFLLDTCRWCISSTRHSWGRRLVIVGCR